MKQVYRILLPQVLWQWHSQDTADTRGPYVCGNFSAKGRDKQELGGSGGMLPQKIWNFLASQVGSEANSGHTVTLNQEHSHYAGLVRGVKSLHYSRQTRVQ